MTKAFLNPEECLNMSLEDTFEILKSLSSSSLLQRALDITKPYPSCVSAKKDTKWAQTLKIVGINPRIAKTYLGIVKYAISFPERGIHLMPIFESGDGSIYVQNSWKLSSEFLDEDLLNLGYDTAEKQLKVCINLLHLLGKIVGFDATAHCDNFSKIVILNPKLFEWIKLNEEKTEQLDFSKVDVNILYKEVENSIIDCVGAESNLFELSEKEREKIIFHPSADEFEQRMKLRSFIRGRGLEPLPVVEHSPMRPILFDKIARSQNNDWAVFKVRGRAPHSKIFGAITPYKLYKTDTSGYPLKDEIQKESWEYFSQKIYDFQHEFNFDFLRADMAHNQSAHSHQNPHKNILCDELWAFVKENIQKDKPYFATIAEAFFNTYYIDGISDMINKKFDIVLGDMNFKPLDKNWLDCIDDFLNPFRNNFPFYPAMCVFSNDGDLSEHNYLFSSNSLNECRFFASLFLNLPSYTGMGFELRDINPSFQHNYSNFYTNPQPVAFEFGKNISFLKSVSKMRNIYKKLENIITNCELKILSSTNNLSLSWIYVNEDKPLYLFIINLNSKCDLIPLENFNLPIEPLYINKCEEELSVFIHDKEMIFANFNAPACGIFRVVEQ